MKRLSVRAAEPSQRLFELGVTRENNISQHLRYIRRLEYLTAVPHKHIYGLNLPISEISDFKAFTHAFMIYKYSALMMAEITIASGSIFSLGFCVSIISDSLQPTLFIFTEEPSSPPPSQRWTNADSDTQSLKQKRNTCQVCLTDGA